MIAPGRIIISFGSPLFLRPRNRYSLNEWLETGELAFVIAILPKCLAGHWHGDEDRTYSLIDTLILPHGRSRPLWTISRYIQHTSRSNIKRMRKMQIFNQRQLSTTFKTMERIVE